MIVPIMRIIPIIAVPMDDPRFALVDIIPDASDCLSELAADKIMFAVSGRAKPNPIPRNKVPGIISDTWVFRLNW